MADDQAAPFDERFSGQVPPQQGEVPVKQDSVFKYFTLETVGKIATGLADQMVDFLKTPGTAYKQGLTPEQETEFGFNAALGTIGESPFSPEAVKALAPIDKGFHETVTQPALERFADRRITIPLNPNNIIPVEGSSVPRSVLRTDLATTGEPHIDAVLHSAVTKEVIDNPMVDRRYDVPYTAGGSVPLQDPTMFIDKNFPKQFDVNGVRFDPAEPFAVHENVEQHTMDILTKGGMDDATAYKVAHFEFAEKAEGAWYDAHGIDQAKAEAAYRPYMDAIQKNGGTDFPPNLYDRPYPHDQPSAARSEAIAEPRPTPQEIERAKYIIDKWQKGEYPRLTSEEIDKFRKPSQNPIQQIRELGADRPSLNEMPPKNAGRAAMASAARADGRISQPVDEPSAWRQRWERTLDKMQTPGDAKRVIGMILDRNDEFLPARQGDMSPTQIEQLGQVTGLDTSKIDVAGTSSKIKTDAEMRNTIEAFRSVTEKIKEAAAAVRDKHGAADDAEVARMTTLEMQRDLLLDATITSKQLAALRAEFHRSGMALQEAQKAFGDAQTMRDFIRDKFGNTIDDVRDRAKMIADTDDKALPKLLSQDRTQKTPWYFWAWQGAMLLSGPITHTLYGVVNTATTMLERVFAPMGAVLIERAKGRDSSLMAPIWAYQSIINGFPDALRGTAAAFKSGQRVPLLSEMELASRDIESPQSKGLQTAFNSGMQPEWGIWKKAFNEDKLAAAAKVLGTPGRAANAQHTFFKILNEKGSRGFHAYQAAYFEKPATNAEFWQRYEYHYNNPTNEALLQHVADGYSGTFMEKLGPQTQRLASALKSNPLTRWIFPFMHIPLNIDRMALKYSPFPITAFGMDMQKALLGEMGGPAQSLALSKVVIGTTALSYFVGRALNNELTGSYPVNQQERKRWKLLGIQPNSLAVDGQWHSAERFGPPGILIGAAGDAAHIMQHYDLEDPNQGKQFAKALAGLGLLFADTLGDGVGFQGIRNITEFLQGEQSPESFISYEASTFVIPSLVRQPASAMDPFMRETKSILDGIKYATPFIREGLMPKRDPLYGEPIPNPGYATIARESPVNQDPIKMELDRLGYYPTAPRNKIGDVTLNDKDYDEFEATAGPFVKEKLGALLQRPGWAGEDKTQQIKEIKAAVKDAREQAARVMLIEHDELLAQVSDKSRKKILGP